jgi:hypothetical protein
MALLKIAVERPELIRIVSVDSDPDTRDSIYTYHLLYTFAHAW